ncbi:MAG: signal peptidase II [Dehalococcoidia bacterium]|nr:signal peptidase II [Dehalococcoidia bacterium]
MTTAAKAQSGMPLWTDPLLFPLAIAVVAADQISKYLITHWLPVDESFHLFGPLSLTHVINSGTAFGLFQNFTFVLTLASVVAVAVLLIFFRTQASQGRWFKLSLAFMLGGAIGNLIDRVAQGHVTDFIHVGWWPVFNIADSAVVVGLAMLMWWVFTAPSGHPSRWPGPPPEYRAGAAPDPGC